MHHYHEIHVLPTHKTVRDNFFVSGDKLIIDLQINEDDLIENQYRVVPILQTR